MQEASNQRLLPEATLETKQIKGKRHGERKSEGCTGLLKWKELWHSRRRLPGDWEMEMLGDQGGNGSRQDRK